MDVKSITFSVQNEINEALRLKIMFWVNIPLEKRIFSFSVCRPILYGYLSEFRRRRNIIESQVYQNEREDYWDKYCPKASWSIKKYHLNTSKYFKVTRLNSLFCCVAQKAKTHRYFYKLAQTQTASHEVIRMKSKKPFNRLFGTRNDLIFITASEFFFLTSRHCTPCVTYYHVRMSVICLKYEVTSRTKLLSSTTRLVEIVVWISSPHVLIGYDIGVFKGGGQRGLPPNGPLDVLAYNCDVKLIIKKIKKKNSGFWFCFDT